MDPLLYVEEEYNNVRRALDESLRYDYGPGQTVEYYEECRRRLHGIRSGLDKLHNGSATSTSAVVSELWDLANRLTRIERSHLGEFSWPFADSIRQIAAKLLSEGESLKGRIEPIIHMIADGTSYQISSEKVLGENKRRRIFTVAFPRQLKHHVLMHALFGHELGHATFYSGSGNSRSGAGEDSPTALIIETLRREGPLRDCASTMQWLMDKNAPCIVRERSKTPRATISESYLEHWHVELLCDLFGLAIFGPAFSAAHRTYLEPSCKSAYEIETDRTSHPAYALRRALLQQAMRILGWDQSISKPRFRILAAERKLFDYLIEDRFGEWEKVFTDQQIQDSIALMQDHFKATDTRWARRPNQKTLEALVNRIVMHLPPIGEKIDINGVPQTYEIHLEEQLYAGWTYWLGKDKLSEGDHLSFFDLNQLCDLSLLQQQAIDIAAGRRLI